ncbi:MAG: alpha-glucan family phosphorylase [Candidatus Zixiibacteriota bacterium]
MRVKQLLVLPKLPERIKALQELAHNLWYSWNWDIVKLFIRMDPDSWEKYYQNPVEMLSQLPQETLQKAAEDEAFLVNLDRAYEKFQNYLIIRKWFSYHHGEFENRKIAYFSLEYGLDTGLPVYSGGLGVLSGDTLKSASDLGLPLVAVGLLYRYGYFRQFLSRDGWQQERYEENDWYHMPVELVKDKNDQPIKISLVLDHVPVQIQIWKVMVGIIPLYLLDTNVPENSSKAREITSVLYGGDKDMRIRQEIVLGIGGVKALKALGIEPDIFHSNEGHSWFLTLERIHALMTEKNMTFSEATQYVWSTTVFTTHTPVPAGNEQFDSVLVHRYLGDMVRQLGLSWKEFLAIGRVNPEDESEQFGMTVAALKYSAFINGVSKLHGQVSREMWHNIWPNLPKEEVPIKFITNGVHPASWISHDMKELYESYFGPRFTEMPGAPEVWDRIHKIPDLELWRVHNKRRERLVFFARKRLHQQLIRRGASQIKIQQADQVLNPQFLTIGFARRFSTYKRGNLVFSDIERLAKIINNEKYPVQFIISGKAHPLDNPGKEIIKEIIDFTSSETFRHRIIFLEDYDINVARYMVQGADVWLNTPRRPLEACGTSGMKASANGALNLSVLDGWWDEGFLGDNGWAIGWGEDYDDPEHQDEVESRALYDLLEESVKPLFYERGADDLPRNWISMMKRSIQTICPVFNAHRMVSDYIEQGYLPAARSYTELRSDNYRRLRQLVSWKKGIETDWGRVAVKDVRVLNESDAVKGKDVEVVVSIETSGHSPEELRVELLHGPIDLWEEFKVRHITRLQPVNSGSAEDGTVRFSGHIPLLHSGLYGYVARVTPEHPLLPRSQWANLVHRG